MSQTPTKPRPLARDVNPDGIAYDDAVRALRDAGYSNSRIAAMIESFGSDPSGSIAWRWRLLDPTDENAHEIGA